MSTDEIVVSSPVKDFNIPDNLNFSSYILCEAEKYSHRICMVITIELKYSFYH